MSNKVIIAAAGSGKTTHLINEALRLRDAVTGDKTKCMKEEQRQKDR